MNVDQLKEQLPEFAKDMKLNVTSLFTNIQTSGLTKAQFYGCCLAVAYSLKNEALIDAIQVSMDEALGDNGSKSDSDSNSNRDSDGDSHQSQSDSKTIKKGAQIAATIMAMNNIYYRAIHLAEDQELAGMPANLRMNAMMNPGVSKPDFELYALAVSAINGCGMCIESHVKQLTKHEVSKWAIQTSLRIAAVLAGVSMGLYFTPNNVN